MPFLLINYNAKRKSVKPRLYLCCIARLMRHRFLLTIPSMDVHWQPHRKGASRTLCALHTDPTAVQGHDLFDDIEPYAHATDMLRLSVSGAIEALEQLRQRICGYAHPLIMHRNPNLV